ncbi:MAG: tetratricopeptide repeat protein [Spirochaetia bacterium]|nr:tetratricopeptide repeat protein [Spirochaetia bacterium]
MKNNKEKKNNYLNSIKFKKLVFVIILGISLFYNNLSAVTGGVSQTYYMEEISAASQLSQGTSGISPDLGQMWYNAAALYPFIEGRNFSLAYVFPAVNFVAPEDFNENFLFLGYAWPGSKSKYALGFSYLGYRGLRTYDANGNYAGEYSSSEFLFGFSHYWELFSWLYFGETLKAFYFNYYYAKSTAASIDLSMFVSPLSFFDIGLSIDNFWATDMKFAVEQESLPVTARFSSVLHYFDRKIQLFYDLVYTMPVYHNYNLLPEHRVGLGVDVYKGYLKLRAGYDGENISAGIGSTFRNYHISAAYMPSYVQDLVAVTVTFDIDTKGFGPFGRPENLPATNVEEELMEFYRGIESYTEGKHKEAYDKFTKVLTLNPEHELAMKYRERAELHLKTNTNWLDEEHKKLIALHKELARKYESQGNYGEAINEWRSILEIDPTDSEARPNVDRIKKLVDSKVQAHHKEGLNQYALNDKLKAIDSFTQALNYNPEYEPSKNWLIKIKQELSREELREREYIERQNKAHVYFNRGLSYFGKKSYEEAILSFDETLKLDPEHQDAKKYRKLSMEEWEADKLGLRGLDAANSFYEKGMKNYTEEKYYSAVKDFEKSIKAHPAHKDAKVMLPKAVKQLEIQVKPFLIEGKKSYQLKKFASAQEQFSSVKKLHPEHEEALEYLERIRKESAATIEFHLIEGKKAFNKGEDDNLTKSFSKSIFHFDEVLKLDPGHETALEFLKKAQEKVKNQVDGLHEEAMVFYNKNDYNPALKKWDQVLDIDPANSLAQKYIDDIKNKQKDAKFGKLIDNWQTKAVQYFQNKDYEKSLGFIAKILEVDPKHRKALELKQMCSDEKEREKSQDKIASLFINGVKAYKKRDYEDAIASWQEVKKVDPQNVLVEKYIAKAREGIKTRKIIDFVNGKKYYDQGNWILAKTFFEKAIKVDPSNSNARNLLQDTLDRLEEERQQFLQEGDKFMRESKYEEAVQAYLSAYRLDNQTETFNKKEAALKAKKYFDEGVEQFNKRNFGLCLDVFSRVLAINPFDKKARDYVAKSKEKGKNQIKTWLERADLALKRKDYKTAYSLYVSVNQIDETDKTAIKGIQESKIELRKKAAVPYREGKEALAIKNYTLAMEKFNLVEEIMSDYEDTNKLLSEARTKLQTKRKESSKKTAASSEDNANINRGIFLYRQGKYKEAIDVWNSVPKTSEAYSKAQKYIARAKLKL